MPQLIKLAKTKRSEDLSVWSWILWVANGAAYAGYAVFFSSDFLLKVAAVMEFSFCVAILTLTLKYRKKFDK